MINNIFYRYYKFFEFIENNLTPESLRMQEYITGFFLSILIYLNTGSLFLLIKNIIGNGFISLNIIVVTIYGICVYIIVYFSFIHKKKYLRIAKKYEGETKTKKALGVLLSLSYIVFTIVFLVIVASNR
jgi:hypothetical protein